MEQKENKVEELKIEGRNAVIEAFRSGKPIDKLFLLDGCQDGPIKTILREAKKGDTIINFVSKDRLDQLSDTGKHQGAIAYAAAYEYSEVEDMLALAKERGEAPFLILLDGINHIPMYELKAEPGYILTNGEEFKPVVTVFEDEVANWHEIADNTDK